MDENSTPKIILTEEGKQEIVDELKMRQEELREKIANEIEIARQQGDLSENAAYSAAMKDKEMNEKRIEELNYLLKDSEVRASNSKNDKIDIGEDFVLIHTQTNKKMNYKLVGMSEADPAQGKISLDSPIGKAVYMKKYGDSVKVELPNGEVEYKLAKP